MFLADDTFRLSPSDLSSHLHCPHLTTLNQLAAAGALHVAPAKDPSLMALGERGLRHESAYVSHLRAQGLEVVEIPRVPRQAALASTLAAMRRGAPVIAQAALEMAGWQGFADILRRVERPSRLGAWSYEPYDTKLAKETKVGAVLQLAVYASCLLEMQGLLPTSVHIVPPGPTFAPDTLRTADYAAYARSVGHALRRALGTEGATYPQPVPHCDVCRWQRHCAARRHDDDHLSLVANITRSQRESLVAAGITTLAAFAKLRVPLSFQPTKGSREAMERAQGQAAIQLQGRQRGQPCHALLPFVPGRGLALLPEPSPGDLFFDFEGDPFVDGGGLEYLWGWGEQRDGAFVYHSAWSLDRASERQAFVDFVRMDTERWQRYPAMHIYHYAPYEVTALKRLMNRYDLLQPEIDEMLRHGLFVDLYAVVRQGLRASVESYSIKALEPLFGFVRDVALPDVAPAKVALETALELAPPGGVPAIEEGWRETVEIYNRDDCRGALGLREWLEQLRQQAMATHHVAIGRPAVPDGEATAEPCQEAAKTANLRLRLEQASAREPAAASGAAERRAARQLLADLLGFYEREEKAAHWEYFRLRALDADALLGERKAIAGLRLVERLPAEAPSGVVACRYSFPPQEVDLQAGDELALAEPLSPLRNFATLGEIDPSGGTVLVRQKEKAADINASAVFSNKVIPAPTATEALAALAESVVAAGLSAGGSQAARDLLLRAPPRLRPGAAAAPRRPDETGLQQACRLGADLAGGVLPIQGPPGTGKTYTGARLILALVARGLRVGVTGNSHQVIGNLLRATARAAREQNVGVRLGHKPSAAGKAPAEGERAGDPHLYKTAAQARAAIDAAAVDVVGGTLWLWTHQALRGSVDVLVIDEAGQLSLAGALAMCQAVAPEAGSLVLLGDPQQLQQPQQSSHPEGAEISALQHLLGPASTIPEHAGVFLERTYRLAPSICRFTSELFYGDRLAPMADNATLAVRAPPLQGAGLWHLPVLHEGNSSTSPEEVTAIAKLVASMLVPSANFTDRGGQTRPLRSSDILVLAPYNAQVAKLREGLPEGIAIGTVDSYQGSEAAIVIISMTSSTAGDAPRGLEFLYDSHRLNVATSRAKAACVLVSNPGLLVPHCRTPRQMKLANVLCRYSELANSISQEKNTNASIK
jgi:uncharacterized protein